jgi:hypothetical protein
MSTRSPSEVIMLNTRHRRSVVASTAAAAIVAGMILAAQPGHAGNDAFATFVDSGEIVSGTPILALDIPPGRYAILAKINIDNDDGALMKQLLTVTCTLAPAQVIDTNVVRFHPSAVTASQASDNFSMPFQLVTDLGSNTRIILVCRFAPELSRKVSFRSAKMTALRLDGSICERPSPARCREAGTAVSAAFKQSGSITSSAPIVQLSVPDGKYAIFAKINIDQDDADDPVRLTCTLQAAKDAVDRNVVGLQWSGPKQLDNAAIPFQLVREFRSAIRRDDPQLHDITLSCSITAGKSSLLSFRFAKVMAVKLDGVLCEKASGETCP